MFHTIIDKIANKAERNLIKRALFSLHKKLEIYPSPKSCLVVEERFLCFSQSIIILTGYVR